MKEFLEALSKAQAEISVVKDRVAVVRRDGKQLYSYRYADLATILAVVKPILAKHGLVMYQLPYREENKVGVITRLYHVATGESIENNFYLTAHDEIPQNIGALVTYARRYAIQAILGFAAEDDDDANAASGVERVDEAKPETIQQIEAILARLEKDSPGVRERFIKYAGVERLSMLSEEQAQRLLTMLQRKAEKGGK